MKKSRLNGKKVEVKNEETEAERKKCLNCADKQNPKIDDKKRPVSQSLYLS